VIFAPLLSAYADRPDTEIIEVNLHSLREAADRIDELSRSTSALQADRERCERESAELVSAALRLARETAEKAGDTVTEQQVADRLAHDRFVAALQEADRRQLDTFRHAALAAVESATDLACLADHIDRLNIRYLRAPMPQPPPAVSMRSTTSGQRITELGGQTSWPT
jgi:uncharacterized protein (DUF2267 family)